MASISQARLARSRTRTPSPPSAFATAGKSVAPKSTARLRSCEPRCFSSIGPSCVSTKTVMAMASFRSRRVASSPQEHLKTRIAHGRHDRAFRLRQLASDGKRNRAPHGAERGRLEQARADGSIRRAGSTRSCGRRCRWRPRHPGQPSSRRTSTTARRRRASRCPGLPGWIRGAAARRSSPRGGTGSTGGRASGHRLYRHDLPTCRVSSRNKEIIPE